MNTESTPLTGQGAKPTLVPLTSSPDLVSRVYEAVLQAVCSGELTADERITQESIAERLQVSRQPVHQALRLLERDGILRAMPNKKGMELIPINPHFVSHLYVVRSSLDALAAKSAASLPRPDLRERGIDILRRGKSAAQKADLQGLIAADIDFHRFIYEASSNPVLQQISQLYWPQVRRIMSHYLRLPSNLRGVWQEHQAIFDAVIAGHAREAEKLSRHHALNSVDVLFSQRTELKAGSGEVDLHEPTAWTSAQ